MPEFIARHRVVETGLDRIIDTVNNEIDEFGVSTIEMFYDHKTEEMCCILDAPSQEAIKNHYTNAGLVCGYIAPIERIDTKIGEKSERLRAIGELAARLAHDLRNPLSVIKNTVEIMESKPVLHIEEKIIYHGRLKRAIDRISHQLEDVLDFVRPTNMKFQKHLLNDVLNSAPEKIVRPDGIEIILPTKFVYCICDQTKIEIVLVNLIVNSIQAMSGAGKVTVTLHDTPNDVTMQVSDTGSGIPENILPKIFEPLFTTKQTGTGLGLASCKKIIEQHGGLISATSKENHGTTFTMILPKQFTSKKIEKLVASN
ncbi:MAG: GHKL domain-containing protein [Thaumarchaeota archaeon]|nr:GHKL domain-containing protein [Nitrososphaerota archaeon]